MRSKLIEAALIECILGLDPNLFYNSPMEACVVVCRTQKPKARRGKTLFIHAVNKVTRERAQSFHQDFKDEPGFAKVAPVDEVREKGGNLGLRLYLESVKTHGAEGDEVGSNRLEAALRTWLQSSADVRSSLEMLTRKADQTIK